MNISMDLAELEATIRVTGYLSLQAGENLAILLQDLGRMDIHRIILDISRCSPVCVGALETLLDAKFGLADAGVTVSFNHPPSAVSKVFQIMGLRADGEPLVTARSR